MKRNKIIQFNIIIKVIIILFCFKLIKDICLIFQQKFLYDNSKTKFHVLKKFFMLKWRKIIYIFLYEV